MQLGRFDVLRQFRDGVVGLRLDCLFGLDSLLGPVPTGLTIVPALAGCAAPTVKAPLLSRLAIIKTRLALAIVKTGLAPVVALVPVVEPRSIPIVALAIVKTGLVAAGTTSPFVMPGPRLVPPVPIVALTILVSRFVTIVPVPVLPAVIPPRAVTATSTLVAVGPLVTATVEPRLVAAPIVEVSPFTPRTVITAIAAATLAAGLARAVLLVGTGSTFTAVATDFTVPTRFTRTIVAVSA